MSKKSRLSNIACCHCTLRCFLELTSVLKLLVGSFHGTGETTRRGAHGLNWDGPHFAPSTDTPFNTSATVRIGTALLAFLFGHLSSDNSGRSVTIMGSIGGAQSADTGRVIEEHCTALSQSIKTVAASDGRRAAVVLSTSADEVACAHVRVSRWALCASSVLPYTASPSEGSPVALSTICATQHIRVVRNIKPWAVGTTGRATAAAVTLFLISIVDSIIAAWQTVAVVHVAGINVACRLANSVANHITGAPIVAVWRAFAQVT